MAVPCEYTTSVHQIAPTTAGWASITPGASTWDNSDWVELLPVTPAEGIAVTGAIVFPGSTIIDNPQSYEIELGTGDVDAEVPFAVLTGHLGTTVNYAPNAAFRPHGIPYELGGGLRVVGRLRKDPIWPGFEHTWHVGLGYYELPIAGRVTTTTSGQITEPPASWGVSFNMAGTALYTYCAWQTLSSGLDADSLLTGIEYTGNTTALFELQLALGSGDSPTVLTTIRGRVSGGTSGKGGPFNVDFFPPVHQIPASIPIRFRFRLDLGPPFNGLWGCKISVLPLPI